MSKWNTNIKPRLSNFDMRKGVLLAISVVMLALLVWLGSTALFNTLSGDDMVFERSLNSLSTAISAPLNQYTHWTARLSNIFTLNLIFSLIPEQILAHFTLLLSLMLVLVSVWYLSTSVFRFANISQPRLFGFAASLVFTLSLSLYSTTTYDNFYWMAGVITYILPLALFGAISGRVVKLATQKKLGKLTLLFLGFLTLIMGLYNEAFVLQGLTVISIVFGFTMIKLGPKRAFVQFAALYAPLFIGLLLAGIVMKLAPGTDARMHLTQTLAPASFDHSFFGLLKMSGHTTIRELLAFLSHNSVGVGLVIAMTLLGALLSKPSEWLRKNAVYIFGVCALVPPLAFFALAFGVHYAYQPSITEYSLITANYFAYLAIILATVSIAQYVPRGKSLLVGLVSAVIVVSGIASFMVGGRIQQIDQLIRRQQKEFNETNSIILSAKQAGKNEINIGSSELYFTYCVPDISSNTWCNEAYRQYYGVKSITATQYIDYSSSYQLDKDKP